MSWNTEKSPRRQFPARYLASNPAPLSIRCRFVSPMFPAMTLGGKLAHQNHEFKDGAGILGISRLLHSDFIYRAATGPCR